MNFAGLSEVAWLEGGWRSLKRSTALFFRRLTLGAEPPFLLSTPLQDAALRDDLVHQANEANKRAALATSQALQGSLRFMVVQKLKVGTITIPLPPLKLFCALNATFLQIYEDFPYNFASHLPVLLSLINFPQHPCPSHSYSCWPFTGKVGQNS